MNHFHPAKLRTTRKKGLEETIPTNPRSLWHTEHWKDVEKNCLEGQNFREAEVL